MGDGDDEEGVAGVGDTGQSVVPGDEVLERMNREMQNGENVNIPSNKGGDDTESAAGLQASGVGSASATVLEVGNAEHEEGKVKAEEEQEEGDGRAQGADHHEEGEDEPGDEVKAERVEEGLRRLRFQRLHNLESTRSQDDGGAEPETTVRREGSSTEGVADGHFPGKRLERLIINSEPTEIRNIPHASQKLDETAVSESSANNDVRLRETASSQVDERQDESGQGESAETERSRVGELAALGGLVETGLEFTTEGGKTDGVPSVDVSQRVAAVVVRLALLGVTGGMVEVVGVAIDRRRLDRLLVDLVLLLRGRHLCGLYTLFPSRVSI